MKVKSTHFNLFALSTAKRAWNNPKSSLPARVCNGVAGAIYDIYVKNPYDLTVGNCKSLYKSPEAHSTKQKAAIVAMAVFTSLYTCMLFGTSIHVAGKGILALASQLNSPLLIKIGQATKVLGEKAFIVGAVPIYGLFYALPKQLIRSFPTVVNFVAHKISAVTSWVFHNVLAPLWDKVIVPVASHAITAIRFVTEKITSALVELTKKIILVANWAIEHVLIPLWEKTLLPALKQVLKAIVFTVDTVIELSKKVVLGAQWVLNNVLSPLWDKVLLPAIKQIVKAARFAVISIVEIAEKIFSNVLVPALNALQQGISYLATCLYKVSAAIIHKVADVAEWAFTHVVAPAWKNLILPAAKSLLRASLWVVKIAARTIASLAEVTAKVASFVFQKVIMPVSKRIAQFGAFLGKHVVMPVAALVKDAAIKAAQCAAFIFNKVIVPVAETIATAVTELKDKAIIVKAEVWETITFTWNKVAARFASQ